MKNKSAKHLTDEQIIEAVATTRTLAEAHKKLGIPERTFYRRKDIMVKRGTWRDADYQPTPKDDHRLRSELQKLRKDYKELIAQVSADENISFLFQNLKEHNLKPPKWLAPGKKAGGKGIACTMLSDTHFDEVVNPVEINHVNAYSRKIAEQRLKTYFDNVIVFSRDYMAGINIEGLVLCLGGDMVSGNIHDELAQSNECGIMETVIHWSQQLAAGIKNVADHFGKVYIPCVTGNHGRNTKKPRNKGRVQDNFDWLIYKALEWHFQDDKRVTFNIPLSSDCRFTVYKTRYQLTHGDQFRGGTGWGGIMSPIMRGDDKKRKRENSVNTPYDILLMGHFHQLIWLQNVIINGSLKGYDEYAAANNFGYEPPQQAFWITDPEHGKTITAPIRVQSDAEEFDSVGGDKQPGWME